MKVNNLFSINNRVQIVCKRARPVVGISIIMSPLSGFADDNGAFYNNVTPNGVDW